MENVFINLVWRGGMVILVKVNGKFVIFQVELDMLLLWVICEELYMIGMKFGCGIVVCGVCSVYIDGAIVWLCSVFFSEVVGKLILIIEGLVVLGGVFYVL